MRLKICKRCGRNYEAIGSDGYFCPECSAEYFRNASVRDRTCRECGKTFPGGPRAWYCPDCRAERRKEYEREWRKKTPARKIGSTDICQRCGKPYTVEAGRQKYCKDCAEIAVAETVRAHKKAYNAERKDTIQLHKQIMRSYRNVCIICGKVFDAETPRVTCSKECDKKRRKLRQDEADIRRGQRKSEAGKTCDSGLPRSGIVGVTARRNGKWMATYKSHYIGIYPTIDEAAAALERYKEQNT